MRDFVNWESRRFIVPLYNRINSFISGVFWVRVKEGGRGEWGDSGSRNEFWRCLWKVRAFLAAVKGVTALIIVRALLYSGPGEAAARRELGTGWLRPPDWRSRLNSVDASSQNWLKRNFRAKIYLAPSNLTVYGGYKLRFSNRLSSHLWNERN